MHTKVGLPTVSKQISCRRTVTLKTFFYPLIYLRDHSDGIWNESQATVLQADSGTENGTGLSASEPSAISPGSTMLLTPSSRRKHLLLLQHQQRSSMDTDALEEEDAKQTPETTQVNLF